MGKLSNRNDPSWSIKTSDSTADMAISNGWVVTVGSSAQDDGLVLAAKSEDDSSNKIYIGNYRLSGHRLYPCELRFFGDTVFVIGETENDTSQIKIFWAEFRFNPNQEPNAIFQELQHQIYHINTIDLSFRALASTSPPTFAAQDSKGDVHFIQHNCEQTYWHTSYQFAGTLDTLHATSNGLFFGTGRNEKDFIYYALNSEGKFSYINRISLTASIRASNAHSLTTSSPNLMLVYSLNNASPTPVLVSGHIDIATGRPANNNFFYITPIYNLNLPTQQEVTTHLASRPSGYTFVVSTSDQHSPPQTLILDLDNSGNHELNPRIYQSDSDDALTCNSIWSTNDGIYLGGQYQQSYSTVIYTSYGNTPDICRGTQVLASQNPSSTIYNPWPEYWPTGSGTLHNDTAGSHLENTEVESFRACVPLSSNPPTPSETATLDASMIPTDYPSPGPSKTPGQSRYPTAIQTDHSSPGQSSHPTAIQTDHSSPGQSSHPTATHIPQPALGKWLPLVAISLGLLLILFIVLYVMRKRKKKKQRGLLYHSNQPNYHTVDYELDSIGHVAAEQPASRNAHISEAAMFAVILCAAQQDKDAHKIFQSWLAGVSPENSERLRRIFVEQITPSVTRLFQHSERIDDEEYQFFQDIGSLKLQEFIQLFIRITPHIEFNDNNRTSDLIANAKKFIFKHFRLNTNIKKLTNDIAINGWSRQLTHTHQLITQLTRTTKQLRDILKQLKNIMATNFDIREMQTAIATFDSQTRSIAKDCCSSKNEVNLFIRIYSDFFSGQLTSPLQVLVLYYRLTLNQQLFSLFQEHLEKLTEFKNTLAIKYIMTLIETFPEFFIIPLATHLTACENYRNKHSTANRMLVPKHPYKTFFLNFPQTDLSEYERLVHAFLQSTPNPSAPLEFFFNQHPEIVSHLLDVGQEENSTPITAVLKHWCITEIAFIFQEKGSILLNNINGNNITLRKIPQAWFEEGTNTNNNWYQYFSGYIAYHSSFSKKYTSALMLATEATDTFPTVTFLGELWKKSPATITKLLHCPSKFDALLTDLRAYYSSEENAPEQSPSSQP